MEALNLHSEGKDDFLNEIYKRFEKLILKTRNNPDLNQTSKVEEIKRLNSELKKEIKSIDKKLF